MPVVREQVETDRHTYTHTHTHNLIRVHAQMIIFIDSKYGSEYVSARRYDRIT